MDSLLASQNIPGSKKDITGTPDGQSHSTQKGSFHYPFPDKANPIGLTKVKLVKKEGNVLIVQGLDAFKGSPVLDIKSF